MVRSFCSDDIPAMLDIWNEIVNEGNAFPQDEPLDEKGGLSFFSAQSYTGVAIRNDGIAGLYILNPNNVGRCSHIANASYAVSSRMRGQHIGEELVKDSLRAAKELGFRILQFNAVVKTNIPAHRLYKKLGFIPLGEIKGGFRGKDGRYEDIIPYYIEL